MIRVKPRLEGARTLADASTDEFAALIRPYLAPMARFAERLCGPNDCDDVVQEALLRAWTKRAQFDPVRGALASWLLAITFDQARSSRRRLRRILTSPAYPRWTVEDDIDVEEAVAKLPRRQHLAVDCFYFAGLSIAETAAVMHCSEGTVKSTLSDARAHLRTILGDEYA